MKTTLTLALIAFAFVASPVQAAAEKHPLMKATKDCGPCCKQGGDCCRKCPWHGDCAPCCKKKSRKK